MKQRKNPILFSIVIANYNYGRFLSDALESIIGQCEDDCVCTSVDGRNRLKLPSGELVEIIVCDGASTDNSIDVIKQYANRIAWWCSEKDGGQSAAFNKGFAQARGRFLTWLNADDVFFPGALMAVAHEIEQYPTCEWFVGSTVWTDEHLRIKRVFCAHRFSFLRGYFATISACGPSSFFTKRLLNAAGGIDETLHYTMDIDLWERFFRRCQAHYRRTRTNVWAYRVHEDSKLSGADVSTKEKALENRGKAHIEGIRMVQRYALVPTWFRPLILFLSFSMIDKAVVFLRTFQLKGRLVHEC